MHLGLCRAVGVCVGFLGACVAPCVCVWGGVCDCVVLGVCGCADVSSVTPLGGVCVCVREREIVIVWLWGRGLWMWKGCVILTLCVP